MTTVKSAASEGAITSLTKFLVSELEPQELSLFDPLMARYFANPNPPKRPASVPTSSGLSPQVFVFTLAAASFVSSFLGAKIESVRTRTLHNQLPFPREDIALYHFGAYRNGLEQLLIALERKVGTQHDAYLTALNYEHQLRLNIDDASRYGDNEILRSERNRIVDYLNQLAKPLLRVSFNELMFMSEIGVQIQIQEWKQEKRESWPTDSQKNVSEIHQRLNMSRNSFLNWGGSKKDASRVVHKMLEYLLKGAQASAITLKLAVDFGQFSLEEQSQFIIQLSRILNTNPDNICILELISGSVLITLEMPEEAALILLSMFLSEESELKAIPITKVELIREPRKGRETSGRVDEPNRSLAKGQEPINLVKLRQLTANYFNETELRDICFDVDVDYENLPGQGKRDKARELVAYFERRGQIHEFVSLCCQLRPTVAVIDLIKY